MGDSIPSPKPFTISIIGGGLAGLLFAIGLSTRNVPFIIYESAACFTETSAGIGFGPNAVRAMAKLDPRIHAAFTKLKTENKWESKKKTWFDFRDGFGDSPALITEVNMGEDRGGNVLRARFLLELVKLLPKDCAVFNKSLCGIEKQDGDLKLLFRDGTSISSDAVVGCDGIRSTVRTLLLGDNHPASKPVFTNVHLYRGVIKIDDAITAVGEHLAVNSQVYVGKDWNLVTYPIEDGSMLNVVAFRKTDSEWTHQKWVVEGSKEERSRDFETAGKCVQHILQSLPDPSKWAIFDMPPAPTYVSDRIALLGDAAHASTSHGGAGAGMAVEDAFILSELFSSLDVTSPHSIQAVFSAYNTIRLPRTQRLVCRSRESGMLYQLRLPNIEDDIGKVRENLKFRQCWIWDIDLDLHLQDAKKELIKSLATFSE